MCSCLDGIPALYESFRQIFNPESSKGSPNAHEAYYNKFMPGLKNILQTVKWETSQEQELRANCIDCIGFIITSVKDQPDICKQDAIQICQ